MLGNLIRDKGREGRRGYTLPKLDVEETKLDEVLPKKALRKEKPRLAGGGRADRDPSLHQPLAPELRV